jgi:hypothetical protein
LQRISQLRHRLEDLKAHSRETPGLISEVSISEVLSDVSGELQAIEDLLAKNKVLKNSQMPEERTLDLCNSDATYV